MFTAAAIVDLIIGIAIGTLISGAAARATPGRRASGYDYQRLD